MAERELVAPLLAALRDFVAWLESETTRGVIVGGVAASVLGRPRATADVDVLVLLEEGRWQAFLGAGARFGFNPRRPDALDFARQARVLLVRHEPSGIDGDIILGSLPFEEEMVDRARAVKVGDISVPLPTPEDLVIMKAVAHRPRDLADIESTLEAHPGLDLRRVRRWVQRFSSAMDMPEIAGGLETVLAKHTKRKR